MGLEKPGYHYDEALLARGAVHMLNSPGEPAFAHDRWSWVQIGGRYFPIMVLPYAGPIKDYLLLVPFALFGPDYQIARLLAAILGAFGIWGFSVLVRDLYDETTAAWTSLILAVHPAYLKLTLYDHGTVTQWMLAFGLMSVTLARYLRQPTARTALWLGLAAGFGVWCRANFVWLLGAALLFHHLRILARHLPAIGAGALIGSAPLLYYEVTSGGATFQFMSQAVQNSPGYADLLQHRFYLLSHTLFSDMKHRAIWMGGDLPAWQRVLFPAVVAIACGFRRHLRLSLTLLTFLVLMFSTRLNVDEHHIVTLVPLAVLLVVVAARSAPWPAAGLALATVYFGSALWLNVAVARGLRESGGTGHWSGALNGITRHILGNDPPRPVRLLDWGFGNSLFVLSGGRIQGQEMFWGDRPWTQEILPGYTYLIHSNDVTEFPRIRPGFLAALSGSRFKVRRIPFSDSKGRVVAEVIEVDQP
ncbi:MAG: glycosyltransferase family 39 protein [Bryobacteraceae bacterium]